MCRAWWSQFHLASCSCSSEEVPLVRCPQHPRTTRTLLPASFGSLLPWVSFPLFLTRSQIGALRGEGGSITLLPRALPLPPSQSPPRVCCPPVTPPALGPRPQVSPGLHPLHPHLLTQHVSCCPFSLSCSPRPSPAL